MKNVLKVIGYILIGIILLPIAACLLYVGLGGALFYALYLYRRIKYCPMDVKEGKNYKTASSVILIVGFLILFLVGSISPLSWQGWLWINLVAFVGLLPLCIYFFMSIKEQKQKTQNNEE